MKQPIDAEAVKKRLLNLWQKLQLLLLTYIRIGKAKIFDLYGSRKCMFFRSKNLLNIQ